MLQGYRLFSNSECSVVELSPTLDMNKVKQDLGEFPKLSVNEDLKIDWDDKHLVLFQFFWGEGESFTIRLWDIEDEPKFLYEVDKGIECITDKVGLSDQRLSPEGYIVSRNNYLFSIFTLTLKVSVHNGHVVMVPSWPLEAQAIVMTLDINNQMGESGKFLFKEAAQQTALDDNWEHTQLRVVRCQVGSDGRLLGANFDLFMAGIGCMPRPGLAGGDHQPAHLPARHDHPAGPGQSVLFCSVLH